MAAPRLNNQSPIQKELDSSKIKVGRSAFDFSHLHSGTALLGALTPVLCMEVVPNEDIDINLSALIQLRNPLTRPLLNGMRVYFHGYCNYLVDLWEGARNFLDNGRSGSISLSRPNLLFRTVSNNYLIDANTPLSLLQYLGIPCSSFAPAANGGVSPLRSFQTYVAPNTSSGQAGHFHQGSPSFIPADCFFAYQRNWRDFYSNKNLLQDNKGWFPDNEDHFILSYSAYNCVAVKYEDERFDSAGADQSYAVVSNLIGKQVSGSILPSTSPDSTPEPNNPLTSGFLASDYWRYPNLSGLKFRQFRGDRFTSGNPFPDLVRGNIPVLYGTSDLSKFTVGLGNTGDLDSSYLGLATGNSAMYGRLLGNSSGEISFDYGSPPVNNTRVFPKLTTITLNDIRALETYTVFKERMARTNGDYNEMIEAQFGYNPHHHVREATYIGGFYTDFHFSTVVQQSQSTVDSALGTKSGDANAQGQGRIGHIHTRDYGWIQVYMSIVPDVMYTNGLARQFSRRTQSDMYFPLFNNLKPQAILNKELYISGNVSVDNDVFAYEDRYAEFKSCLNRVSGFMALPHQYAEFDSSRIMARRFTSTPSLNNLFVSLIPENVDMQVFSVVDEPPFDFQIGFDIRRVSPMPYTAIPGSISSLMHA